MGLFGRRTTDDPAGDRIDERDRRTERAGTSPGLVRALFTLLGVAAAGLLIWIAHAVAGALAEASTGEYWVAMGLIAGAGLALGLSQLFGGWTKWGWPTLSPAVFLLGFLPTLVVGGWIVLANQPQTGIEEGRFDRWSSDLGISGFVDDIGTYLPAIPLIVGLVLAFSFDTTGPRTHIVTRERTLPDEDVHDYRTERPVGTTSGDDDFRTERPVGATGTTRDSDRTVAEDLRTERPVGAATGTTTESDRTVAEDLRTRESASEGAPAGAARVEPTDERRRS
jgi:hypothetical protein